MLKPNMVAAKPNPPAERVRCCGNETGLLMKIAGQFCLFRDDPDPKHHGRIASTACTIALCRGCYASLSDKEGLTFTPWVYGKDEQLDEHIRMAHRQISAIEAKEAKLSVVEAPEA